MAITKPEEIRVALAQPFAPEDLEWRLQVTVEAKNGGFAVPYVTNRAIQSRLDEVVGPENWHNDYKPWHTTSKKESQICGLSIYFENRGWVTKWDGAEDTDVEPIKGGLSDSMKRAAVQWGIGRVLYNMDTVWVNIEKRGKSYIICDSERPKLDRAYMKMLEKIRQIPAAATGAQAQLTPTAAEKGTSAPGTKVPAIPAESKAMQEAPAKIQTPSVPSNPTPTVIEPVFPQAEEQDYEFIVDEVKVQKGMSSETTHVTLKDKAGKALKAFARGAHDDLQRGSKLVNVKISVMHQNMVVFNMLQEYEILKSATRAA